MALSYTEIVRINGTRTAVPEKLYIGYDQRGILKVWKGSASKGLLLTALSPTITPIIPITPVIPITAGVKTVTASSTQVTVDNTDSNNPIIDFNGVSVDGITITGDGTTGNPLVASISPGFISSVSDTNTIDLDVTLTNLTANVRHQNTATVTLADDASGLKASFTSLLVSQFTNDVPYLTSTGITPAALTKTDDTNIGFTLTGTPGTSLLQAVNIAGTWIGTLADGRIASASTWNAKQAALSGTGIVKSTAGVISYLTDNSANWDTAYTNRITSLTTTGTNTAATLVANVLNIPQYGKLFASGRTTVASTNTTSEEANTSVLIPAGTLGNNDMIRITCLWSGSGAGSKTPRIRLHTASGTGGTIYANMATGTLASGLMYCLIVEKNASNAQEGFLSGSMWGASGNAVVTSSLSTASDIYINFTTQKATGTDALSLNNYSIEIIRS